MLGDQGHRIATGVTPVHGANVAVYDDLSHAIVVVIVAVLTLIALLVVLARLEPRKQKQPTQP